MDSGCREWEERGEDFCMSGVSLEGLFIQAANSAGICIMRCRANTIGVWVWMAFCPASHPQGQQWQLWAVADAFTWAFPWKHCAHAYPSAEAPADSCSGQVFISSQWWAAARMNTFEWYGNWHPQQTPLSLELQSFDQHFLPQVFHCPRWSSHVPSFSSGPSPVVIPSSFFIRFWASKGQRLSFPRAFVCWWLYPLSKGKHRILQWVLFPHLTDWTQASHVLGLGLELPLFHVSPFYLLLPSAVSKLSFTSDAFPPRSHQAIGFQHSSLEVYVS